LGLSHRFEVSVKFGTIRPTLSPEEREILKRAKWAMAHERYGEATLLFDSLAELEPRYRPAKRFLKVAMRDYEGQDRQRQGVGKSAHLSLAHEGPDGKDDPEAKELMALLNLGSENQQVSSVEPQASTLPPYIPASDPAQPLKVNHHGGRKP